MDPFTAMLIANAAGGLFSGLGAASQANKQLQAQQQERQQQTALTESQLDPFRQQMSQAGDLARLDAMAHSTYSPVEMSTPGPYAKYIPQFTGGFNWDPSPYLRAAAAAEEQSVGSGQTAPTMTNPSNYGRTSALNLAPATGTPRPMQPVTYDPSSWRAGLAA